MEELLAQGMSVEAPSEELATLMREATADMAGDFAAANPAAGPIIEEFRAGAGG